MEQQEEKTAIVPSEHFRLNKLAEFELFAKWLAISPLLRQLGEGDLAKTGISDPEELELIKIKTAEQFAARFGVTDRTLRLWKKKKKFWDHYNKNMKAWGRQKTPSVLLGLYRAAVRDGDGAKVKLWLQFFEDWVPREENVLTPNPIARLPFKAPKGETFDHDEPTTPAAQ